MSPRNTLDFPENLYLVIGVSPSASDEEVRRAIRRRQRETHPDLGGNAAEFTRVRLAAEVLGEPHRRADHDAWLGMTQGIVTPVRRSGVRLRKQQRTSVRRPAAPPAQPTGAPGSTEAASRASTRHAAAGSDVPAFERIPKPRPDARRMSWYRRPWMETADVWPGAKPVAPRVSVREWLFVAPFVVLGLVAVIAAAIPGTAMFTPTWPLAALAYLVALAALWMRAQGRSGRLALVLCWCAVALAALGAALGFVAAMSALLQTPQGDVLPGVLHGVVGLAAAALIWLAWRGLSERSQRVELERMLSAIADESAPAVSDPTRVWGEPGQRLGQGRAEMNPVRAQYAARIVADALAPLQRIPGVRIIHGLRTPGADPEIATISHAIVSGRRVALISDELWRPGTYAVDARGRVLRDGAPAPSGANEFPHRVERFFERFGDLASVRGWLVIAPDRPGDVVIDQSRTWKRVRLATPESMLREVGEWLAEDGERVDRLLLRDVLALQAGAE